MESGKLILLPYFSLEIIKSWFHLMDEDGWIAREQILGQEARSKVPQEFTIQYPHYANPPTLFMALEAFMDKSRTNKNKSDESGSLDIPDVAENLRTATLRNPELSEAYLRSFYPLMKRHYNWFRNTQRGDIKSYDREAFSTKEAYRWRGRSEQHILTSGIDDYPRAQPPHPGELHVDLISWMGMMTRTLRRIAETLGEQEDAEEFAYYENAITRNIDDLHWNEKEQTFCDATIDEFEESVHVCHKGYISIFPFLTGMLGPDSPRLKAVLDLINDPEELWSDYGIRSLSKKDKFYGTEENYWRSPIWMPINYLVLKNLYVSLIDPPIPLKHYRYPLSAANTNKYTFRTPPSRRVPTRSKRGRCTPSCARTWSKTFSRSGRRLVSPGNSITPTRVRDSERSTLPAGPVWW
jgi:mannosyl-oligosaccharide glucosidase